MKFMEDTTEKLNTAYTYDSMSRVATISDGTNTAEYTRLAGTNLLNSVIIKEGANTRLSMTKTYDAFNRLLSTSSVAGATTRTYTYEYNDKDQRTKLTLADGSYWLYTYDDKGQVISGVKKDSNNNAMAGQSFNYSFDDIGNRLTETKGMAGMDYNYTANNVNQYTQRTIPGAVPIAGSAATDATVRVKDVDTGQVYHTTRDGKYFSKAVPVDNSTADKEANLEIHAVKFDTTEDKDIVKTVSGKYMVKQTPQTYTYDTDGNMTGKGEWTYTWNGENRKIAAEKSDMKLEFSYDYQGRRFSKKVYTGSTGNWTLSTHQKFVYNGYKQIAEYDASDVLQKTYTWQPAGLDVPLWVKDGVTYYYYITDGNKNIRAMVDTSANEVAQYDYNPFGKIVVSTGIYMNINKYRFSSEYHDGETGLVYYNYRYYDADLGRWINRDPIAEKGGNNLYAMVQNNPVHKWDHLGLKIKCCKGKPYDTLTHCCCNGNKIIKSKDIIVEYLAIKSLTKKYSDPKNSSLYGGYSNKSYWAIGFWGKPYQCSEQAADYIDVMLSLKLKYWNLDLIGGKTKKLRMKHHVARVSCICRTGDCPKTGNNFIIDPFNSDFSGKKSEKDFWKEYSTPITGCPLK